MPTEVESKEEGVGGREAESVGASPIERALAEIEQLGNERNLIIIPPPPVQPRSVLSGEQDEALQGAIGCLRAGAGAMTNNQIARRWLEWADILDDIWRSLR